MPRFLFSITQFLLPWAGVVNRTSGAKANEKTFSGSATLAAVNPKSVLVPEIA